jgi:predicted HicB family RNase H-like nuclease
MPNDPDYGRLQDGTEITEKYAAQLADEVESDEFADKVIENWKPITRDELEERFSRRGRRSLAGGDGASPKIQVRLTQSLHARAEARAKSEGKTVSEIAREALERYIES